MITNINSSDILRVFKGAAKNLDINKALIDSLNVFPVPDGDTGTNMSLTLSSTVKELESVETDDAKVLCDAFSRGALKGARGNSGVILSQIFKGMSEVMGEARVINSRVFAQALKHGSDVAYDVVTQPKEGTILTVIRLMGDYAIKIAPRKTDFLEFFELILKRGDEVLSDTPNMLPVLKKAGVVDAGGKGLLVILSGMYNTLAGIEMEELPLESGEIAQIQALQPDVHNLEDVEFAYCTEFFVINLKKSATVSDIDKLRDKLSEIGDCVLVIGDLSLVKVHIHTNNPDKALGYALALGELDRPKIENMLEQAREFKKEVEKKKNKPMGLVTVCVGDGISDIFKELGADAVVEGGQTMNPSVSDIVNIVDSVSADTVFILPNNSNIILAAEQARELTKPHLVVIATKNIPQGIAAAINFNTEISVEENTRAMQKAAEGVRSGQVTYAVRNTEIDGFELKNGDIIGIYSGIVAKGSDIDTVTSEVVAKMTDDTTSVITLYYGEGVEEEGANALAELLQGQYPYHDVMVYYGGQGHYYYFISVE
ncbi:MAG: DAK2 domain-containing protein [Clostridia bacterium]